MKKTILIFLLILFVIIFSISVYKIVSTMTEYSEGTDTYDSISEDAVSHFSDCKIPDLDKIGKESVELNENKIPTAQAKTPVEVDYKELNIYNPDIIGWIYCPGTNIDYPVLKSDDNDYYLRRMANKQYNIAGSIFMDYRNYGDFTDVNTLIYGHNMKNGTMFSDIVNYKSKEYYEDHPYIYYNTEDKNYIFKVVASRNDVATDDDIFSEFEHAKDLQNYLYSCDDMKIFDEEIDFSSINNLVTLSTCSNDAGTKRYLVFCIPVEITEAVN